MMKPVIQTLKLTPSLQQLRKMKHYITVNMTKTINVSLKSNINRGKIVHLISKKADYLKPEQHTLLEESIYKYSNDCFEQRHITVDTDRFIRQYITVTFKVLRHIGSEYIKEQLQAGKIKVVDLPAMRIQDLQPKLWADIKDRASREANLIVRGSEMMTYTTLYKCSRCHQKKCVYKQEQTRSADEGITNKIRCCNCGLQWKEYN